MAAYVKIEDFVNQLCLAIHDLNTHVLKCALSNVAPNAATADELADITQIANGNGYTTGGEDTQNTYAESGGTGTLTGTKIVWTSSGAGMAQFRYVVLYNDTSTGDKLIAYWDYASGLTLGVGETFTIKFNNADPSGTILTIT